MDLFVFCLISQNHYIVTSRELTRLQGVTEAPVTDHLTETFLGAPTVRCFRKEDEFYQTNLDRINSNLSMCFHNYAANEWLGFRLELIGTLILSITAFLMISLPSNFIKKGNIIISISLELVKDCVIGNKSIQYIPMYYVYKCTVTC